MIRRWLVGLIGVRAELLRETPGDTFRYIAMAGVLLTTAAIAAVSATFALQMAVHVALPWAILLGIAWGIVILNLDRLLVISMTRHSGWKANLLAAVPRLALAILLGVVISTPLVLRIFEPEINTEIQVLNSAKKADFEKHLDGVQRYNEIPGLEQELAKQNAVAAKDPNAVEQNPAVVDQQKRVDAARAAHDKAFADAYGEIVGTSGTHVPGVAEAAREAQAKEQHAKAELDQAEADLAAVKADAKNAAQTDSANAKAAADRIQHDIDQRNSEKNREIQEFSASVSNDDGLLARLEALNALSDQRPDLGTAQMALFLLFLSIEVLPVFVKLLHLFGPLTEYEKLSARTEAAAEREAAKSMARRENTNDFLENLRMDLEQDQAQRQFDAGVQANKLLVDEQLAIAEQEIRRWSARESERRNYRAPRSFDPPPESPIPGRDGSTFRPN
ncbi:DUF4407 domain-containing protein [Nocardia arthritidis]|nr:DUF4407 domain-containing protein [Nocardia arthritidis]